MTEQTLTYIVWKQPRWKRDGVWKWDYPYLYAATSNKRIAIRLRDHAIVENPTCKCWIESAKIRVNVEPNHHTKMSADLPKEEEFQEMAAPETQADTTGGGINEEERGETG